MNHTRLALLVAICTPLAATGCIERLPPRPAPEVPPYPQEKFDSPLNAWHSYQRAGDLLDEQVRWPQYQRGPLTPEQVVQLAAYLEHQQPALTALDRAIAAPYCVVPRFDFQEPRFPEFARIRDLARLRTIQGRVLMHQGDTSGAVDAWLDTIELGHDMMQEGVLIGRLVGIASDAIGSAPLRGFVQQGQGTARDYREIITRFTELEANRFPYADMLGREFAGHEPWLREAAAHPTKLVVFVGTRPGGGYGKWKLADIWETLAILTQSDVVLSNYYTYWSMVIEDAGRPYPQRDRMLAEKVSSEPVTRSFYPTYSKARMRELYDVARLRAVVVMAGLQLYRLDNGKLPATLDDLRPDYLPEVPRDPYSDQPYGYLRLPGDRFVVYSVGPDGKDDRAEVELEWPRETGEGDIIFREGEGEPTRNRPQ